VNSERTYRRLLWLLLALLWFATLGYRDLVHPDEGRYAEIAREMAESGDWVTPHLDGLKYFEKPALHYWISATAFKLFGESEFVARLWPGLSGFLLIVLLHFTAKKYWGLRSADYTALVAAGSVWLVSESHYLTLDMGLAFFMSAALCGFLLAFRPGATTSEQRGYLFAVWGAMAGAVLTKGLIGVVLPAAVLVIYTALTRHWFVWKQINWVSGILFFLLLSAPWFIVVSARNPEFFHFFFIHEQWERYTTTEHERVGSWYYFVPILLAGLLPWTAFFPTSIRPVFAESNAVFRPKLFLLVWTAFIFIFFSLSGSKLPSYILPTFPALTLLVGEYINQQDCIHFRWHARIIALFWLAVGIILLHAAPQRDEVLDQAYFHWAGLMCMPCAACCVLAGRLFMKEKKMLAVLVLSLSTLIFAQAMMQGHQIYSPQRSAKTWVHNIRAQLDPHAPFYTVSFYNQTLPFYLGRTVTLVNWVDEFDLGIQQAPDKVFRTPEEFLAAWKVQSSAAAIMEDSTYDRLGLKLGNHETLFHDHGVIIIRKTDTNWHRDIP
jgi:hypothetical protein